MEPEIREVELNLTLKRARLEPPKKSGEYLCLTDTFEWIVIHYSAKHQLFNVGDEYLVEELKRASIPVVWWTELPKYR